MILIQNKPKKTVNPAYLKIKPTRTEIEIFKTNLIDLLDSTNDSESEEFHKNILSDFLKKTYYEPNHYINTKDRKDLVIHNGNKASSSVGVIIETKKPTNKSEMVSISNLNTKAFQELILYYLRERFEFENLEVKQLIITNNYEWFIFDAVIFEKLFAQNKNFVKKFQDFEEGRLAGITTDFFYKEIAEPYIADLKIPIEFTYFDLNNYQKPLRNNNKKDDKKLIALYKLLSPEHLLKLPFANDSNSLDKQFYSELLHIIGLSETKVSGKKLIDRNKEGERNSASLLEDAIIQLKSLDKLSRLPKPSQYGKTEDERLFNVGLELAITWMNRILFLKLLEAQLFTYHKGDKSYSFLNKEKIKSFDDLNTLFFQVLARKFDERNEDVIQLFEKVPYLNSSLFEPTDIEHDTLFISNLRDDKPLPILPTTVLKDENGKRKKGEATTLSYLFDFLDSYDFSSEGSEEIQEDNKTLINASVLGLIFEKINGYKDGSFFTPGLITMYMCRETIRKAVVQKFNEVKNWKCDNLDDVYNKIDDLNEANEIVNNIKICDPAVGSGHFLVSALNEIIAVKNDLRILQDRNGRRLKEYQLIVENDELIVTDEDGELFEYNPTNSESQRVQEALFHEKQTLIENCLFGVDINPNSVKICRLRLWIELLKNAYYKNEKELETLPNIDINIKYGNSLVSRFELDSDLKQALKSSKWTIDSYKLAVSTYRNANSKEQKREMEKLINDIKSDFSSEISKNDPKVKKLYKLKGDLTILSTQTSLFDMTPKQKEEWNKNVKKLTEQIKKLETEIEEIKANKIYENAFEWRFEFPEILNDDGDFVGFDAVIGNPPYIQLQKMGEESVALQKFGYETFQRTGDIYALFYEKGWQILKPKGVLTYITSNKWMRAAYGKSLRQFFADKTNPEILIDFSGNQFFESATVDTNILMFTKDKNRHQTQACIVKEKLLINLSDFFRQNANLTSFKNGESWVILSPIEQQIKEKIERIGTPLKDWDIQINYGIKTGFNEAFIIDGAKREELINQDPKSDEIIRPLLRGRDIKRYSYEFADLYLLYIPWHFPLHNDLAIKGNSLEAEKAFENQYPAVYNHLFQYKERLSKRNKAETGIRYEWYALQRWGANYWEDFSKQKIIFQEMVQEPSFILDLEGKYICLDTARIITGDNLEILISVLNSKLFFYAVKTFYGGGGLGESGIRMKHTFFEQFQIPTFTIEDKIELENNVKNINQINSNQIDKIIYKSFSLTDKEIKFIECQ